MIMRPNVINLPSGRCSSAAKHHDGNVYAYVDIGNAIVSININESKNLKANNLKIVSYADDYIMLNSGKNIEVHGEEIVMSK